MGKQDSLGVLASVETSMPSHHHMRIDEDRLVEVCAGIEPNALALPTWNFPTFYRADPDALAGQILLFGAVNFCSRLTCVRMKVMFHRD